MSQSFIIQFRVLLPDEEHRWIPIDHLLGKSGFLVDIYLSVDGLHCCDFQGGFFIDIDGETWSDDGMVDEFWMTMSWFRALREILDGAVTARAVVWEESNLRLHRDGDTLAIVDVHHGGDVVSPLVHVPLRPFTDAMLKEGTKFARLIAELREEIASRRAAKVPAETEEKFREMERNFPDDIEQALDELAVRLR